MLTPHGEFLDTMNVRTLGISFAIALATVIILPSARADDSTLGAAADTSSDATKRSGLESQAASGDSKQAALALYQLAEMDDHDFRFASALARYDASIARDPSHRYALRARAHADTLRAHSEGDFAPYAELERVRRDRSAARDPQALMTLASDADHFPPGAVRVEARMLAGDAFMAQGDRTRGLALLELVDLDSKADPILQHQAAHELVEAYLAQSDAPAAMAVASRPKHDPALLKRVKIWQRRQRMRAASIVILAVFALFSTFAIGRSIARGSSSEISRSMKRFAPLAIAFAAWVGVFGGILAASFERGNESPFLVLAVAAVPIFLIARAWGATGSISKIARVGRALFSAASIAAVAFVVLTYVGNGIYLAGFGL